MKMVWFDMDGTLYNLYDIPNWLESLRADDMTVFGMDEMGRKSLPRIREAVTALIECGWQVGVITWAPIDVHYSTIAFSECELEKFSWLERNIPELADPENFYCLEYGESKRECADMFNPNAELQVLVDDNKAVRADWRTYDDFITINASRGYIKELLGLVG